MADTWLTIEQAAVALGLSVRTVNRHIVAGKIQSRLSDGRREVLVDMPEEGVDGPSDGASDEFTPASPFAAERLSIDSPSADYARQVSDYARQPSEQVRQTSESTIHSPGFDPTTVLALADNAAEKAEMAISAYQALARLTDTQFRHVRRSARLAWASVAVMAAGVAVAVGWTSHHLTEAQVHGQHLQQQVRSTADTADRLSADREALRTELAAAREQAARAEGQVSALADAQAKLEAKNEAGRVGADADVADVASSSSSPSATQPTTRPTFVELFTSLLGGKGH